MERLRILEGDRELWVHTVLPPALDWIDPPFAREPFVVLVVNFVALSTDVQNELAVRIVAAGCRYAVCTGHQSSSWDDAIDWAYLATCDFQPSDETLVMTTWHDHGSPEDVAFFFLHLARFDDQTFTRYLLLFVGHDPQRESRFVSACLQS